MWSYREKLKYELKGSKLYLNEFLSFVSYQEQSVILPLNFT